MQRAQKHDGSTVRFVYASAGHRVRKVWRHGTVEERIYLGGYEIYRRRDGNAQTLERHTLHVTGHQERVALVETKTFDGQLLAAPDVRARYQLTNHLGSAVVEADDQGRLITYEEYHPFGTTSFHSVDGGLEVSAKRYRYGGKERDEETGFYYY